MFTNLIESDSHRKEFKRRSSFFLATISAYALILSAAGVASIYAYDAHLEAQNTDLTLLSWVPPVVERDRPQQTRRVPASTNTGRISPQPVRPVLYESASNPRTPPSTISVAAQPIPPAPPNTRIGNYIGDPVAPPSGSTACITCTGSGTAPLACIQRPSLHSRAGMKCGRADTTVRRPRTRSPPCMRRTWRLKSSEALLLGRS